MRRKIAVTIVIETDAADHQLDAMTEGIDASTLSLGFDSEGYPTLNERICEDVEWKEVK